MGEKDIKYLIIPDIHGRKFWKEPVKYVIDNYKEAKIIFLGDYHDPYGYEKINLDESVENFKEIIELKKNHSDRVILLIGNHDSSYIGDVLNCYCRHDMKRDAIIRSLFWKNHKLFNVAHQYNNMLFSHAGVCPVWIDDYDYFWQGIDKNHFVEYLNNSFQNSFENNGRNKFWLPMKAIGYIRGGDNRVGSIIWSDMEEHVSEPFYDFVQVFGHTQQSEKPVHYKNLCLDDNDNAVINEFYNLDCRETFYLDGENNIRHFSNDELIEECNELNNEWIW